MRTLWLTWLVATPLLVPVMARSQPSLEVAFPNLVFDRPVDLQNPGDGSNRLFVVEQKGMVRTFANDSAAAGARVFLDIRDRVIAGLEDGRGLLGLAFHPNFENNHMFFVHYTAPNPLRSIVARYETSAAVPDSALKNTETIFLSVDQPSDGHNGGQLAFGPDGYLYIAIGDGGEPLGTGQNRKTLLGAVSRIDVDNPENGTNYGIPDDNPFAGNTNGYREEIYAYGLRNPWRFSFDALTGALWLGDVGDERFEEINIITNGGNYGWSIMEGAECYAPPAACDISGLEVPFFTYEHNIGHWHSITGGYVYRGTLVPEIVGKYLYADFVNGRIWALDYERRDPPAAIQLADTTALFSTFGVDENDELYTCDYSGGRIYRFRAGPTPDVVPKRSRLTQNTPNPFLSDTRFDVTLDAAANVDVRIYDVQGKFLRTLVHEPLAAGTHPLSWDGRSGTGTRAPSGIYFYRLLINGTQADSKRMVLMR